ncbi:MAG TPA: Gfo/Idh/MocA family oxidoreductase [Bryobacteraceae bacterium]|nr:Gfo/Idh/MocA family oxidoreductase [Bryobacteraceae bacterium]
MIGKVLVIGGGMIVQDQVLPSLLHLKRLGKLGAIEVCSVRQSTIDALRNAALARNGFVLYFPGMSFDTHAGSPDLYRDRIAALPPKSIVFIATPDPLHYEMAMAALRAGQHVICVKPLALRVEHAREIGRTARELGLFCGIEYHKRFDDRSLMARRRYRMGSFGHFRLGHARLLEKWYYRESNFQNWFTRENSDAFTYIGCHYVDLVAFITGLRPVAVSVFGIPDRFPNGNEGWLWTDARVLWENGACLNVQNALSFPDAAPGTNTQGLTMYCSGDSSGALIEHSDQYRGLKYSYIGAAEGPGATQYAEPRYAEPSPDYFEYVEWSGPGMKPVGYGYRSIEALVEACERVTNDPSALAEIDAQGLLATPGNSDYNEQVIEAGRMSLERGGDLVRIS